MVRRHQFPVYLTLTKSCIYARNHTLRTWWCAGISFHCTSHSPNHAYMHEIIHLEPPPTWKKQPRKKSLPKATKRLEGLLSNSWFSEDSSCVKKAGSSNCASDRAPLRCNRIDPSSAGNALRRSTCNVASFATALLAVPTPLPFRAPRPLYVRPRPPPMASKRSERKVKSVFWKLKYKEHDT